MLICQAVFSVANILYQSTEANRTEENINTLKLEAPLSA